MATGRRITVLFFVSGMLATYGDAPNITTIPWVVPEGRSVVLPCDLPQYDPQKDFLWVTIHGENVNGFLRRYAGSPPDELQIFNPQDRNRTDISLVPPDFTSLRIGSVTREDEDIFECRQPQADSTATRYQLIVGFFSPGTAISGYGGPVSAGTNLILNCTSGNSNPAAEITWTRDGTAVAGTNNGQQDGDNGGTVTTQQLVLNNLQPKDSGMQITCLAFNSVLSETQEDTITPVVHSPQATGTLSSTAIIIISVLAALTAIAVVIIIACWCRFRHKNGALGGAARVRGQEQQDYISLRGCCSWVCCPTFNIHYESANQETSGESFQLGARLAESAESEYRRTISTDAETEGKNSTNANVDGTDGKPLWVDIGGPEGERKNDANAALRGSSIHQEDEIWFKVFNIIEKDLPPDRIWDLAGHLGLTKSDVINIKKENEFEDAVRAGSKESHHCTGVCKVLVLWYWRLHKANIKPTPEVLVAALRRCDAESVAEDVMQYWQDLTKGTDGKTLCVNMDNVDGEEVNNDMNAALADTGDVKLLSPHEQIAQYSKQQTARKTDFLRNLAGELDLNEPAPIRTFGSMEFEPDVGSGEFLDATGHGLMQDPTYQSDGMTRIHFDKTVTI